MRAIFHAMNSGWVRAFRMPLVLFVFYLLNLLTAIALIAPFTIAFVDFFEQTGNANRMFEEIPVSAIVEFTTLQSDGIVRSMLYVTPVLFLYAVFHVIVVGGVVQRLSEPKRIPVSVFLASCIRRLPGVIAIEALAGVLASFTIVLPMFGFFFLAKWMDDGAVSPWPLLLTEWFRALVVIPLFVITAAVRDYSRAALTVEGGRNPWRAFWVGMWAMFRSPIRSMGTWLSVVLVAWIISLLLFIATSAVLNPTLQGLLLAFGISQIAVIVRVTGGVARLAAAYTLLETLLEPAPPAEDLDPMPSNLESPAEI